MSRFDEQWNRDRLAEALKTYTSEAWEDANARRMVLVMVRYMEGYKSRLLAKNLGISIFAYQRIELGREPLSREMFERAVSFLDVTPERLDLVLQGTHEFLLKHEDALPKLWREKLAVLDAEARRSLILADPDLWRWGLGKLLCDKSLEAANSDEAVSLAELAVQVMDRCDLGEKFHRQLQGYARAHLGHALQRRGDPAAESLLNQAIEQWMSSGAGASAEDELQADRLAAIVPGFSKAEALKTRKRKRTKHDSRSRKDSPPPHPAG